MLDHTGFAEIRWGQQIDVFSGSKHESDAAEFDTRGVTLAALRPSRAAVDRQSRS
ncbi:MAG: hypothetical protein IH822_07980 [Chloroflexi bacterium]|nr:hypothetical protein [Chloroflexota bacterium]